jgi:DUF1365 family protein
VTSYVYRGTVVHARRAPVENVFRYGVAFYLLDLDELGLLDARLRLFGNERRRLVTLRSGDHLGDPRKPLRANVDELFAARSIRPPSGRVLLLTSLRVAGYVFNPVSFLYCHDDDGALRAIVAEVSNTFGEMHPYLLTDERRVADPGGLAYVHPKEFHVSPFMGLDADYRFRFSPPAERLFARVDEHDATGRFFSSTLAGTEREPLTDGAILRTLARHPLASAGVVGRIHLQALRLWRRGAPFHRKPPYVPGRGSVPR